MTDDLVKFLRTSTSSAYNKTAADHIEKLVEERDGYLAERNKFKLYLQRTHADLELEVAAVDALSGKLAKAVEALRWYDDRFTARKARDVLAELEGKE